MPPLRYRAQLILLIGSLAASVIYLVFEVAFHAHLVDFLGGTPTDDEIHSIERNGRTLTGIAAALFFIHGGLGAFIKHRLTEQNWRLFVGISIPVAALFTLVCIQGAQTTIDWVVTTATDSRSEDQRRQALLSTFIVSHVHQTHDGGPVWRVNGRPVVEDLRSSISGRFVLAALPFLLATVPDLEEQMTSQLRAIVESDVADVIPSAHQLYNKTFVSLMEQLIGKGYDAYRTATSRYQEQLATNEATALRNWGKYLDSLRARGLSPDMVRSNPKIQNQVSQELRRVEPALPTGWVPMNYKSFLDQYEGATRNAYREALRGLGFDERLAPGIIASLEDYVQHADIKARWCAEARRSAQVPALQGFAERLCAFGPRLGPSEDVFAAFRSEVYEPLLARVVTEQMARLSSAVDAYAAGGRYFNDAYKATKTVIVIPIALVASLLGGIFHLLKCMTLTGRLTPLGNIRWASFATACLICLGAFWLIARQSGPAASLPDDPLTAAVERGLDHHFGATFILRRAVELETVIYPVGQWLLDRGVYPGKGAHSTS